MDGADGSWETAFLPAIARPSDIRKLQPFLCATLRRIATHRLDQPEEVEVSRGQAVGITQSHLCLIISLCLSWMRKRIVENVENRRCEKPLSNDRGDEYLFVYVVRSCRPSTLAVLARRSTYGDVARAVRAVRAPRALGVPGNFGLGRRSRAVYLDDETTLRYVRWMEERHVGYASPPYPALVNRACWVNLN